MVRTGKQALGFYIVYSLIAMLIVGLVGMIGYVAMGLAGEPRTFTQSYEVGHKIGATWGIISLLPYVLFISTAIVVKKKLGIGYYVLCLVNLILTILAGPILGLMPVAFMTTRSAKRSDA
jgi:hypothetical protein